MWIKTPEDRMINMNHVSVFSKHNDEQCNEATKPKYAINFVMSDGRHSICHFWTEDRKKSDANYEKLCDLMERGN